MRYLTIFSAVTFLSLPAGIGISAADNETQYPLGSSHLLIEGGSKPAARRVSFSASGSKPATGMPNPKFAGATLRIIGGPGEGDSGLIRLLPGNWDALPKGKGYRYKDRHGFAG